MTRLAIPCLLAHCLGLLCSEARAQENVDPLLDGSRYAYGENVGWLNAEPLGQGGPGVNVGDPGLTGYLWSENVGWISLSCANTGSCATVSYGVANDGAGALSGFAWGENVGWINFAPAGGGVTIDATTGTFVGRAWGENIGWITFSSSGPVSYRVQTSWPHGVVQLGSPAYAVAEGAGSAIISVTRTGGSHGTAQAGFATSDGTASAGLDYTAVSGTLAFADGDSATKTFNVPILDDAFPEGDETVNLSLSGVSGALPGSPGAAVLTILDHPGTLQFSAPAYSVHENTGAATITVTRAGGAGGTVAVDFATADGTANAPADYLATAGTLTFPAGSAAGRSFTVPILFDLLTEGNETVRLSLGGPTGGAALGSPGTALLTILDTLVPPRENVDPAGAGARYAFSENFGWLNAEPLGQAGAGLRVGSEALAGYLWSENAGWFSLSCANTGSCARVDYGVRNDGAGALSGFAWGENVGWVNFAPAGGGISIDPASGSFRGRAWGENIGWITFGSTGPVPFGVRAGCPDSDGDGFPQPNFLCPAGSASDCDDGNAQVWSAPLEVRDLLLAANAQSLSWSAPVSLGGISVLYDSIRSQAAPDFGTSGVCVESNDGLDRQATDSSLPAPGRAFFYLVRAENACPDGQGPLGFRSNGQPIVGRACP
jgi:Calx-beta domain